MPIPGPNVLHQVVTAATGHIHQPGCEWICGRPAEGYREYWCVCLNPKWRKRRGQEARYCADCQASEHPEARVAR